MKHHWRIIKTDRPRDPWQLQNKAYMPDGYVSPWQGIGYYATRKSAVAVGMIMRERGEPISWDGGPIRMGIALVESCPLPPETEE